MEDVRRQPQRLVSFSPEMAEKNRQLKTFLGEQLYRHYQVLRMSDKAGRMITDLFNLYSTRTEQLPPECQERCKKEPVKRVAADYIAGMTDRYAAEEYRKLFLPLIQV